MGWSQGSIINSICDLLSLGCFLDIKVEVPHRQMDLKIRVSNEIWVRYIN